MRFSPRRRQGGIFRLMRKIFLVVLALFVAFPALACEPCAEEWDLQTTANKADLIVIGMRNTPILPEEEKWQSGPENMEISVLAVLKGEYADKKIITDGWYGMCPYGIVLSNKRFYIIYLTKEKSKSYHQPLNSGCAVKATPLANTIEPGLHNR